VGRTAGQRDGGARLRYGRRRRGGCGTRRGARARGERRDHDGAHLLFLHEHAGLRERRRAALPVVLERQLERRLAARRRLLLGTARPPLWITRGQRLHPGGRPLVERGRLLDEQDLAVGRDVELGATSAGRGDRDVELIAAVLGLRLAAR